MKKLLLILLTSTMLLAQNVLVGIAFGYSEIENSVEHTSTTTTEVALEDNGFLELSLNYMVNNTRMKTSIDFRYYNLSDFPYDSTAVIFMQNMYKDFDLGLDVKPFLKLGLGIGQIEYSNHYSEPDGILALSYGAGLYFDFQRNLKFSLVVQQLRTTDVQYDGVHYDGYRTQDILFSYIFTF